MADSFDRLKAQKDAITSRDGDRRYWVLLYDHGQDRQIRTYETAFDSRQAIASAEARTGLQAVAAGYAGPAKAKGIEG